MPSWRNSRPILSGQVPRLILYHKHPSSARTRFLRLWSGSVLGPTPLPDLSRLLDPGEAGTGAIVQHPAPSVRLAERELGLVRGGLEPDGGFRAEVEIPGTRLPVFLARFVATDPPLTEMGLLGAEFIDLMQARGIRSIELLLLRRAYEHILGG